MTPFLTLNQVGLRYPDGVEPLRHVSFVLPEGAFMIVVGKSGSGKSSLLRLMGGLLRPTSGQIVRARPDASIGIVFQQPHLMPWRTVAQNVRLPLELAGSEAAAADARVAALLRLVGLVDSADSYPAQLSGGMAQRVALARALAPQPDLLLLDEPFGALDAMTRETLGLELLNIWRELSLTVFMVTHDIREAVRLADEVLVLGRQPASIVKRLPIPLPRPRTMAVEATAAFHASVAALRQAI